MSTIYQAITTKYVGPTNTKGGRIIATTESGIRHTISYPHELTSEQGHRKAAEELAAKLNWQGKLAAGGMKTGYCFVMLADRHGVDPSLGGRIKLDGAA